MSKPKNISSDGVPNRKGGSWPNHPSMRYELPIPFTPLGPPSDSYRDGWDRIFGGGRNVEHEAGVCGTECPEPHASPGQMAACPPVPEAPATPEQTDGDGHYHIDFDANGEVIPGSARLCHCTPPEEP